MCPAASKKKWTKTQNREKREWASVLVAETAADIERNVPRSKLITPSKLADRYKISLTLARKILKQLVADGKLEVLQSHHTLDVYGRGALPEPVAETVETKTEDGEAKKGAKGQKQPQAKQQPKAAPKAAAKKPEADKKDAKKK
jgi:small subunit ribosomal protein S25e